jgi:hypothetical protein
MRVTRKQLAKLIKESIAELYSTEEWEVLPQAEKDVRKVLDLMFQEGFEATAANIIDGIIDGYANENDSASLEIIYKLIQEEYPSQEDLDDMWNDRWEHSGHMYADTPVTEFNEEADKWFRYYAGIYNTLGPILNKLKRLLRGIDPET